MEWPDNSVLDAIPMEPLAELIQQIAYKEYFLAPAGVEHYRLLAFLAQTLHGDLVDIGTHLRTSALALSYNEANAVYSFDVMPYLYSARPRPNMHCTLSEDCIVQYQEKILAAPLILLDVNHTGTYERKVYQTLVDHHYQGLLMLDDIHLNPAMKAFWRSIDQPKVDLSHIGHWSGTGMVLFGEE